MRTCGTGAWLQRVAFLEHTVPLKSKPVKNWMQQCCWGNIVGDCQPYYSALLPLIASWFGRNNIVQSCSQPGTMLPQQQCMLHPFFNKSPQLITFGRAPLSSFTSFGRLFPRASSCASSMPRRRNGKVRVRIRTALWISSFPRFRWNWMPSLSMSLIYVLGGRIV